MNRTFFFTVALTVSDRITGSPPVPAEPILRPDFEAYRIVKNAMDDALSANVSDSFNLLGAVVRLTSDTASYGHGGG